MTTKPENKPLKIAKTLTKATVKLGTAIYHQIENYAQGEPTNNNIEEPQKCS